MNVYEVVFILALLASIGIFIAKFYNVVRQGKLYTFSTALLLFGGNLITWLFILIVFLNNATTNLYNISFKLISLVLVMQVLFLIIELFYNISSKVTTIEAHHAIK